MSWGLSKFVDTNEMKTVHNPVVNGPALFGYRFKVTSNQDGSILGTGFMTASKALNKAEQMELFHNCTHGKYRKAENYISVSIFEAEY